MSTSTSPSSGRARPFFCGNWKLFGTLAESVELAVGVREGVAGLDGGDVAVAPSFVALATVAERLRGGPVAVAAQDCFWEKLKTAFTGEVATAQIADAGATHVIIGHSERRQHFGETDETVNKKTKAALAAGLTPIVCFGELLAERKAEQTLVRVAVQLDGALKDLSPAEIGRCVLAYEPVWAIGTGEVATPAQAQEVHRFARGRLAERMGAPAARGTRIIYGGSVKPDNIAGLMAQGDQSDIDGALVGGASLTASSFVTIVKEGIRACIGH
jgi:triosephosphate isomerase